MAGKIEEVIAAMPTLKVDLKDIFNFENKCLDPLASEIIAESLDYALETSIRRLESVSKINPRIYENATTTILPAVKTLRDLINKAPECDSSALATADIKPPPRKPILTRPAVKKEAPKKATSKTAGDLVENITKKVTKAKAEAKPVIEATATIKSPEPVVETLDQEEARALAKLSPERVEQMKVFKQRDIETYEDTIRDILKLNPPVKITKIKPEAIEVGKQFTIAFDGQEAKFSMVDKKVAGIMTQQPVEKGVLKLSDASTLAKEVAGKKIGDTVMVDIEGKKYKAEIKEVKDGAIHLVEEKK